MRETIHYTVELLANGNFNIYNGDGCRAKDLRWENISPEGAAECLGGWVVTWAQEEKAKRHAHLSIQEAVDNLFE